MYMTVLKHGYFLIASILISSNGFINICEHQFFVDLVKFAISRICEFVFRDHINIPVHNMLKEITLQ